MNEHLRHPDKHEWNIAREAHHAPVFMAYTMETAIKRAVKFMGQWDVPEVRLYHTHPSPGPMNRYVGIVKSNGTLVRPL